MYICNRPNPNLPRRLIVWASHLPQMLKQHKSHEAHSTWYEKRFPGDSQKEDAIQNWIRDKQSGSINYWIHEQMFKMADPLCSDLSKTWLTVGDGYGFDANYFFDKGLNVTASDISSSLLPLACEKGIINQFSVENVENLSFSDGSFDYVFCKESYHHFPRPYLGVYEMLRVAREGVVIIEPQDPISKSPLLMGIRGILDRFDTATLRKLWKNQYSFEEVGNYVFKLSLREMEKLANGIGIPCMAVRGLNINFYSPEILNQKADDTSPVFRKIKRKKAILDFLNAASLLPEQVLCVILLKKKPNQETQERFQKEGFRIYHFPENPYL
jgi:ubiquinone/menaquinone biosynthesis C-methylase UbiE